METIMTGVNAVAAGCVGAGLLMAGHAAKKGDSPSFMLKWAGFFFLVFFFTS